MNPSLGERKRFGHSCLANPHHGVKLLAALSFMTIALVTPVVGQDLAEPDPLEEITAEMRVVVGRLSKLTTNKPTQETQKEVIDKLDILIAALEKECEQCKGARASANPSKPAADSNVKSGPGGMGKLHAARQDGDRWGELPAHERDRILQSMNDGFPAHYQTILETYFRRVAEEKPADEAAPKAGSKSSQPKLQDKSTTKAATTAEPQ
jgi:hypothetical protein